MDADLRFRLTQIFSLVLKVNTRPDKQATLWFNGHTNHISFGLYASGNNTPEYSEHIFVGLTSGWDEKLLTIETMLVGLNPFDDIRADQGIKLL